MSDSSSHLVDEALQIRLKESRKLSIVAKNEQTFLLVMKDDICLLGIPVLSNFKFCFVGEGIFSVHLASGSKEFYFQTESLLEMWKALSLLSKAVRYAILDNVHNPPQDQFDEYFMNNSDYEIIDYMWISKSLPSEFLEKPVSPASPEICQNNRTIRYFNKPDLEKVTNEIRQYLRRSVDVDSVTEAEIITYLRQRFGHNVVGEYGYSSADIQERIFICYGQIEKPTQIDEKLYLGSQYNASNWDELTELGITHILNVTVEVDKFFPKSFKYHQVPVLDQPSINLLPYFHRGLSFIESALLQGGTVFVHCQRGVSRSATFVIAHMMRSKSLSLVQSLELVKGKRRIVRPNSGFITQLQKWENDLPQRSFVMDLSFQNKKLADLRDIYDDKKKTNRFVPKPPSRQLTPIVRNTKKYSVIILEEL